MLCRLIGISRALIKASDWREGDVHGDGRRDKDCCTVHTNRTQDPEVSNQERIMGLWLRHHPEVLLFFTYVTSVGRTGLTLSHCR